MRQVAKYGTFYIALYVTMKEKCPRPRLRISVAKRDITVFLCVVKRLFLMYCLMKASNKHV